MKQEPHSMPTWDWSTSQRTAMSSGVDLLNQFGEALAQSVAESLERVVVAMRPTPAKRGKDECEHDVCYCECCICDADLVIYARLGERRVIPIVIENSRRRERQIRLELSNWTTHSGKPGSVTAQIVTPTEFVLPPCAEDQIVIVVETTVKADDTHERQKLPDVDECTVLYADLRIEGCGIRPVRIALALLPRDCYVYKAECDCSCC